MSEKVPEDKRFEDLRRRAEKLPESKVDLGDKAFVNEYQKMLQELDVYRTEMEIQNEELQQAQVGLQAAHRRYQNLFEIAPVGYLLVDKDGLIVQLNAAARELLGDESPLTGRPLSLFVSDEFTDTYLQFLKDAAAGPGVSACEVRMNTAGDKTRFIRIQGTKENPESKDGNFILSLSDITELKKARQSERDARMQIQRSYRMLADTYTQTEKLYHSLIENANEGAAITQDGRVKFVNPTLAGILGGTPEELVSKRLERYIHEDDRGRLKKYYMQRTLGKKAPMVNEIRIVSSSGETRWVRQNDINIQWQGKPALLHFVVDITEHKAVKDQLEMERRTLKSVMDNIPVMVIFYDREGRVLLINKEVERLLEWEPDAVRGTNVLEQTVPDEALRREVWDFMLRAEGKWTDFQLTSKSGKVVDASCLNVRLPDGGHMGIGFDISDRKQYERSLIEAQKRLEGERHVLRTILDSIPVMIYFYDSEGQAIFANREFEQLIGWSLEEMQKIDVMEACFPDEKLRAEVLDFMIQCPPEWRDHPITTKSGRSFESSWYNVKLPDGSHIGIGLDVSQRKQYERELLTAKEQLEIERAALEDKNIALREVLSQIEAEKDIIKNRMLVNIRRSVLPGLSRLNEKASPSLAKHIELIEKNLKDIAAPFLDEFSDEYRQLTARELEICRLIKDGLRTKEMAEMLNVSIATIQKHRESIRRKLKLTGKGTNLYTFLQTFTGKVKSSAGAKSRTSRRR